MKKIVFLLLLILCSYSLICGQRSLSVNDLTVLKEPADTMMRSYLTRIVDRQFALRDSFLATLRSDSDWDSRAKAIRDSMVSWTGPLPNLWRVHRAGDDKREIIILEGLTAR